jgi:hypothetical protein
MDDQELNELRAELAVAQAQIERLRQFNDELQKIIRDKDDIIRQAKDINPIGRVSLKRVLVLARAAFLDISKVDKVDGGGWILNMGTTLQRKFKSLRQIWDLLNVEDWYLTDLFDGTLPPKLKPRPVTRRVLPGVDFLNQWVGGARQNYFDTWNHFTVDTYRDISSG